MSKEVGLGNKIELTALQLVMLVSDAIEEYAKKGGNHLSIASDKVVELFNQKSSDKDETSMD